MKTKDQELDSQISNIKQTLSDIEQKILELATAKSVIKEKLEDLEKEKRDWKLNSISVLPTNEQELDLDVGIIGIDAKFLENNWLSVTFKFKNIDEIRKLYRFIQNDEMKPIRFKLDLKKNGYGKLK